jgi:recombination protein RecA
LAIWYQDDGGFTMRSKGLQERTQGGSGRSEICVQAMEPTTRVRLRNYLADTWGVEAKLMERGARKMAVLQFSTPETAKLHALIAPFVHPSMEYKLLPKYRGRFAVEPVFGTPRETVVPVPIKSITPFTPPAGQTHRYDLEVEGSHNYFAGNVMIHNSPETTPGGRALKFYSSVRLDIRRIESIKDGVEVVGNRTRVKVVKNKCVAAGTMVFDPTSGVSHRIEDLVEKGEATHVVASDKIGGLHVRPVTQRFDQGEAEVIGLRLRDGTVLRVTPDHKVMTDTGWREAGELAVGDRLARPRSFMGFGDAEPVTPDHARLLGYLIGDGYVGGKTPVTFINIDDDYVADVSRIAADLGCDAHQRARGYEYGLSHRKGERNGVLELVRWAGIHGHLAWEKKISAPFFEPGVSADVVANLLFGIWATDGYVTREQTGAVRVGFTTTSEQLAHQIHWLLLRWGIGSTVAEYKAKSKRPSIVNGRRVQGKRTCWETRISGVDNVRRFAQAMPVFGRKAEVLAAELAAPTFKAHRGSQRNYLPAVQTEPVLAYLRGRGVTPALAASLVGDGAGDPVGGLKQVLGHSRLRRDRIEALADGLDSEFLREVLAEEVWYDKVVEVLPAEWARIYDIEVDEHHTFVANDVVVSNCAPPFRQAEFDIMYGKGISREGGVLDIGVDNDIVKKSGAWYTYEGEQLGQGRENAKQFLTDNPEIMIEISERIRTKMGVGEHEESAEPDGAAVVDADDLPISLSE